VVLLYYHSVYYQNHILIRFIKVKIMTMNFNLQF